MLLISASASQFFPSFSPGLLLPRLSAPAVSQSLVLHFCLLKSDDTQYLAYAFGISPLHILNICVSCRLIAVAATIYWNGLVTDFIFLGSKISTGGD